jgi:hypothetical protein
LKSDELYQALIRNWLDKAGYAARPYQQLERSFADAGRPDLADFAFESMKDHERNQGRLSLLGRIRSWIFSLSVRYGREPSRAFIASLLVVVFGYFVFRQPNRVEPRRSEDKDKIYDPFWYSLVLFLPLSTLPDSDTWVPKETDSARRFYARVHALLGWILIPVGLAAISGLIPGK